MRLRSVSILGSVAIMLTLTMGADLDCDDIFASSLLDGMWFAAGAATNAAANAAAADDGEQAGQAVPGEPGAQGEQGDPGLPGEQGAPGEPGADGLSCWDLNGNGVADPEEDINADGDFNALDCQGADGLDGVPGEPGLSCWDLNGNGVGELEEDINGDGNLDALDCQGPPGEPAPFQVVASAVIQEDGSTQSGNNILGSAWLGFGFYEVVFDVSEVDIPEGAEAGDFPVFVTVVEPYAPPTPYRPTATYLPESLEDGELTIHVHIRGPFSWPLDSGFSVQVLEPGVPWQG